MSDDMVGKTIADKYRLEAPLGQGGMGVVYRATELNVRGKGVREVAVKMIRPSFADQQAAHATQRFLAEIDMAMRLENDRTVPVYASGTTDCGAIYYVMRLIEAPTLREVLRDQPRLPIASAVEVGRQICEALHFAHTAKPPIVHRDLKPPNVFVEGWPQGISVRLGDFGISKELRETMGPAETAPVGTPWYMAPEQWAGAAVDGRTDLYSLGVLLHEALAGRVPFEGDATQVMYKHINVAPPPLPTTVPEPLQRLVGRLMAKQPADRPATADAVGQELAAVLRVTPETAPTQPLPVLPASPPPRPIAPRRRRALVAASGVLLTLAGPAAAYFVWPTGLWPSAPVTPTTLDARLDRAERALVSGMPSEAIDIALQVLAQQKSDRAFSILARSYCRQGEVAGARGELHKMSAAQQATVLADCRSAGVNLN